MTAIYKKELKSYLTSMIGYLSVSYTHLDVYKRQFQNYGHSWKS